MPPGRLLHWRVLPTSSVPPGRLFRVNLYHNRDDICNICIISWEIIWQQRERMLCKVFARGLFGWLRWQDGVLPPSRSYEKCYGSLCSPRLSSQPFMGHGASHCQLGRRSRFCACPARRCRKVWRRIATTRSSIEGHCARFGAATGARTRSRALARGMRGAHAVVVCGQGVERRLRLLVLAVDRDHGGLAPRRDLICAAGLSAGPGGVARFRDQPVELTAVLGGFRQKPFAERDDLRQLRDRFRADDPIARRTPASRCRMDGRAGRRSSPMPQARCGRARHPARRPPHRSPCSPG